MNYKVGDKVYYINTEDKDYDRLKNELLVIVKEDEIDFLVESYINGTDAGYYFWARKDKFSYGQLIDYETPLQYPWSGEQEKLDLILKNQKEILKRLDEIEYKMTRF